MLIFHANEEPVVKGSRYKGSYWKNIRYIDYLVRCEFSSVNREYIIYELSDKSYACRISLSSDIINKNLLPISLDCIIDCKNPITTTKNNVAQFSLKFKYIVQGDDARVIPSPEIKGYSPLVFSIDPSAIFAPGEALGQIDSLNNE
tara:strand:- start:31232 stop:31669 length:438 start_codon:yes stop_codon:yes gene_type:complete